NTSRPECIEAMTLAKGMYQSTAQRLYAPLKIPENMRNTLVLGAYERDISGGDALTSTASFEKLPFKYHRSVYWSTKTNDASRIVVKEISRGWRGDAYSTYVLEQTVSKEQFMESINSGANSSDYQPVVLGSSRPPLVFEGNDHNSQWFVTVGEMYQTFADWRVYALDQGEPICTIVFTPPGRDPAKLLPDLVTSLVKKLDEALGSESGTGTLHPIVATRQNAEYVLMNAALRPWALWDGDAYNSRDEVDAGLEAWAKENPKRRRLYNEIQKAYPVAMRSLATYYANEFQLPKEKAKEVAIWALDLVYRSFFVFSTDGNYFRYKDIRTNPWPMDQ
ncbi:MAG: hypothetical protein ACWGOV_05795, partial [Acidiferrobacterales bacterium]